ncbi:MAG: SUMF1/EgtB/PvdO family nonheme iron enzyme [Mariniblastus sp.]
MTISPTEWKQIEDLFAEAIKLPRSQRQTFVESRCLRQPAILKELTTLLESHDRTDKIALEPVQSAVADQLSEFAERIRQDSELRQQHDSSKTDHSKIAALIESVDPDLVIDDVISRGGTSIVFRALQKSLGRYVAVKALVYLDGNQNAPARFVAESKATASVRHQNVVDIYSVQEGELPFLIMEHLNGPSLGDVTQTIDRLPFHLSAKIVDQVADGLQAAHDQNLVHRDVKPTNVMFEEAVGPMNLTAKNLRSNLRVKLIDFGIVRDLGGERHTLDKMLIGTPAFMSPEQLFFPEKVDHRSDIYALGVVLYELLTGTRPYLGAPHMIMRQVESRPPTSPRQLDDRIPRDLESICLKAMQYSPNKRYQSANEFSADVQRFLNGQPTVARPVSKTEHAFAWCRRNGTLATALGLSCLLVFSLVIGSLTFALVVAAKDREIQRERSVKLNTQLNRLLDAEPGVVPLVIESAGALEPASIKRLQSTILDSGNEGNRKLNAAVALSKNGDSQTELIISLVDDLHVSPSVCSLVVFGIQSDSNAIEQLKASLAQSKKATEKAKRIILLAHLGDWEAWEDACQNIVDPTLRTECIHLFPNWHGDLKAFAAQLDRLPEQSWNWTVCQAILELDSRSVSQVNRQRLNRSLKKIGQSKRYENYHFSQLAMQSLNGKQQTPIHFDHPDCVEFSEGIRMIRIQAAKSRMGAFDPGRDEQDHPPRNVEITNDYFVSETEISVRQYAAYLKDELKIASLSDWKDETRFNLAISPTDDHPVQAISFFEAAKFCNWLSRKHGLAPAYRESDKELTERTYDGTVLNHFDWELIEGANGFRLPTDAQWEFAARNHSQTLYFFGSNVEFIDSYGIGSAGRMISSLPVRHLRPNSRGLYGMLGNVWEWTDTIYEYENDRDLVDPRGPEDYSNDQFGRVHQGGGVANTRGNITSEARGLGPPFAKYFNVGFRVALGDDFEKEARNSLQEH